MQAVSRVMNMPAVSWAVKVNPWTHKEVRVALVLGLLWALPEEEAIIGDFITPDNNELIRHKIAQQSGREKHYAFFWFERVAIPLQSRPKLQLGVSLLLNWLQLAAKLEVVKYYIFLEKISQSKLRKLTIAFWLSFLFEGMISEEEKISPLLPNSLNIFSLVKDQHSQQKNIGQAKYGLYVIFSLNRLFSNLLLVPFSVTHNFLSPKLACGSSSVFRLLKKETTFSKELLDWFVMYAPLIYLHSQAEESWASWVEDLEGAEEVEKWDEEDISDEAYGRYLQLLGIDVSDTRQKLEQSFRTKAKALHSDHSTNRFLEKKKSEAGNWADQSSQEKERLRQSWLNSKEWEEFQKKEGEQTQRQMQELVKAKDILISHFKFGQCSDEREAEKQPLLEREHDGGEPVKQEIKNSEPRSGGYDGME